MKTNKECTFMGNISTSNIANQGKLFGNIKTKDNDNFQAVCFALIVAMFSIFLN